MHARSGVGGDAGAPASPDLTMTVMTDTLAARAQELGARREAFVRATVVRAQHPTSAHAGDSALVLATGEIEGFVGGNCVEASVRRYSLDALASHEPILLRVVPGEPSGVHQHGAIEVSNPCLSGGEIEIFLEPKLPAARVTVVGTTPVALALATLARDIGMDVDLTDGASATPRPDDAALVVASHGKDEEPALEAALRAGVPYVALVASETRGAAVLASLDVDEHDRSRVFSPAGLRLGATGASEIALSILAQLVSERAGRRGGHVTPGGAHSGDESPHHRHDAPTAAPTPTAIDPVCYMTVAAVNATLHVDIDGVTTWFCAPGCRKAFIADPERYAAAG